MSEDATSAPAIDRKVWIPQVAMILTFGIGYVASKRGVDLPAEIQVAITGIVASLIGTIVGVLVPMAKREILGRLNNELVAEAQSDPANPVDLSKVIDDRMILQAQLDPTSPATIPKDETVSSLTTKLKAAEKKHRQRPEEKV